MIFNTDSAKNTIRAQRPYRNLLQQVGKTFEEPDATRKSKKSEPEPEEDKDLSFMMLAYSRAHSRYLTRFLLNTEC